MMTPARANACIAVAILVIGACLYANTLDGRWVWDDASSVLLHEHVQNPQQVGGLFLENQHAFGRGAGNFYRPLLATSFLIDFWLSYNPLLDGIHTQGYPDVKPLFFHLSNLIWHLAAALLFLLLLQQLGAPLFVRAGAPLLWLVHPLATEAVAYISGRADMMAGAFLLAALCCALRHGAPLKRAFFQILSLLFFLAALLSKESALIFPAILAAFLYFNKKADHQGVASRLRFLPLLPALMLTGLYLGLRMTLLRFTPPALSSPAPLPQRLMECTQALAAYLGLILTPTRLHMERSLANSSPWMALLGALVLLAALALMGYAWRKKETRLVLAIALFGITWLPISGLFPLNAPLAEHWMYLPMLGFWWGLTECAWRFVKQNDRQKQRRLAAALLLIWGLFFSYVTVKRNNDWHSNRRLFEATLQENPATRRVHYNLALSYEALEGNLAGAARHYQALLEQYEALKITQAADDAPACLFAEEIEIRVALAQNLMAQQRYPEAMPHLQIVLCTPAKTPAQCAQHATAAYYLGACFLSQGDVAQANIALDQARKLAPKDAQHPLPL